MTGGVACCLFFGGGGGGGGFEGIFGIETFSKVSQEVFELGP